MTRSLLLCVFLLSIPLPVFAVDTPADQPPPGTIMYVSDELWITIRSAPMAEAERVAVIPTGTRMTLLEYEADSEYAKIRTDKDQTGWVLFRYLTAKPVAALRVPELQQQLAEQTDQNQTMNDRLAALKREKSTLEAQLKDLTSQSQAITEELNNIKMISQDAIQTHQKKQDLQQQLDNYSQQANQLEEETKKLRSRLTIFTIISVIAGLLIGLYIGTTPLRRDKRWRSMP